MATYQQWNDALIAYVTQGLSVSSHVFLSIDEDVLEIIGQSLGTTPPEGWSADFKQAVRGKCLDKSGVNINRFANPKRDSNKRPRYVAFLAAMVLAAHYMGNAGDENAVDPKDFFTHFNSVLGLEGQHGRTKGLDSGEDGKLWEDWAAWLRSQGFVPTAYSGEGGYRYVTYPISQSILRQSDKHKLWTHFNTHKWSMRYDENQLMAYIRRDRQYLTRHLQEILDASSALWIRAYDTISHACYEVYQDWIALDSLTSQPVSRTGTSHRATLEATIHRTEDYFSGKVEYRLFPRQSRQFDVQTLVVAHQGSEYELVEERPGWYSPLWELNEEHLNHGVEAEIITPQHPLKHLILPQRDFWVLTLDPDVPESGTYAAWGKGVAIGERFILLIRESLRADLQRLNNEGLLEWGKADSVWQSGDWWEYGDVLVQAEPSAWMSMFLDNEELRYSLQPRTSFGISLIGGLRAPRGRGWLVDHGPALSIASLHPEVSVEVIDDELNVVFEQGVEAGQRVEIPWPRTGIYTLVVKQEGLSDERIIRILDWYELEAALLDTENWRSERTVPFFGAFVSE